MPRAEEMLVWAGLDVPNNARLPSDDGLVTSCPSCGETQTLAEAEFVEGEGESVYTCKNGCQPILIIGAPNEQPWPGRGYRMGDFVLRNATDLSFRVIDQTGQAVGNAILLPASPAALADESEAP
jgi:hypothetical protein